MNVQSKVVALILFFVVLASGTALITQLPKLSPSLTLDLNSYLETLKQAFKTPPSPTTLPTPLTTTTQTQDQPSETVFPQHSPSPDIQPTQQATREVPPQRECYRFTVTHLDGSQSGLCYGLSDYNQLLNLSYQLSSAKTFYNFHIEGASRYSKEYERTGSSIYLNARQSSLDDAAREKAKIDDVNAKIYTIEQRGN